MSEGRDATGNRDWPWERRHDEEDAIEDDLRIDRWTLDAIRGIGATLVVNHQATISRLARVETKQRTISRHLAAIDTKEKKIMAALDTIKDALAAAKSDALAEHEEVMVALGDAAAALAALQAKVDELTAGAVTQAEIDAVASDVADVDTAIKSIYTAPVVEPPVV